MDKDSLSAIADYVKTPDAWWKNKALMEHIANPSDKHLTIAEIITKHYKPIQ